MKITKNKDHFYGRKLNDIEVKTEIQNNLVNFRHKLPDDFKVSVTRASDETLIKIIFQEDAYKPTCPHGFDDCISDPAYLVYMGYRTAEEMKYQLKTGCTDCDGDCYDDEDK